MLLTSQSALTSYEENVLTPPWLGLLGATESDTSPHKWLAQLLFFLPTWLRLAHPGMDPNTPEHYHDSLVHEFSVGIWSLKMMFFGYEMPAIVLLLFFLVVIYLLSIRLQYATILMSFSQSLNFRRCGIWGST
jgi:hypothetical protein